MIVLINLVLLVKEFLKHFAFVFRCHLIQLRFTLGQSVHEFHISFIGIRMLPAYLLQAFRSIDLGHVWQIVRICLCVFFKELFGIFAHFGSGSFDIAKAAAYFVSSVIHHTPDSQDLICCERCVGHGLLDGRKCSGKQSAFLANCGEVYGSAILCVANQSRYAFAGLIVQALLIICNRFGYTIDAVNVILSFCLAYSKRFGQGLSSFVALPVILGFFPAEPGELQAVRIGGFGFFVDVYADVFGCTLELRLPFVKHILLHGRCDIYTPYICTIFKSCL